MRVPILNVYIHLYCFIFKRIKESNGTQKKIKIKRKECIFSFLYNYTKNLRPLIKGLLLKTKKKKKQKAKKKFTAFKLGRLFF